GAERVADGAAGGRPVLIALRVRPVPLPAAVVPADHVRRAGRGVNVPLPAAQRAAHGDAGRVRAAELAGRAPARLCTRSTVLRLVAALRVSVRPGCDER